MRAVAHGTREIWRGCCALFGLAGKVAANKQAPLAAQILAGKSNGEISRVASSFVAFAEDNADFRYRLPVHYEKMQKSSRLLPRNAGGAQPRRWWLASPCRCARGRAPFQAASIAAAAATLDDNSVRVATLPHFLGVGSGGGS